MVNILIVDDDGLKRRKIVNTVERTAIGGEITIIEATSVVEAAARLKELQFDLLILDVNLPMRPTELPSPENGAELLRQIQMRKNLLPPAHIVGLTGYRDVFDKYTSCFQEFTWSLLLFDQSSDGWERRLAHKIEHIRARLLVEEDTRYQIDLCVVTALEDVELREVLLLDANWRREAVAGDDTVYYRGRFARGDRIVNVVAAAALQMGMPAATGLAMKMCMRYRPRYLALCGIAAGAKGNYGDILVADKAWDYGSGKSTSGGQSDGTIFGGATFAPAPTAIPLDPSLLAKVGVFRRDDAVLRRIESRWGGPRAPTGLACFLGPIASGAAVIENSPLIEMIKTHDRKLIGVEMEAYGVFLAAQICPAPRPKAIVIKAVSDKGDTAKRDEWQRYAAFTSAQYLYELALAEL